MNSVMTGLDSIPETAIAVSVYLLGSAIILWCWYEIAKRLPNPSARRATKSFSHPAERRATTSQFPAFYAPANKRSTASSDVRSTKACLPQPARWSAKDIR